MIKRSRSDSGNSTVEFALLLPILMLILVGIIEFGRAYNMQLTVTAAAREGVRVMAIENDVALAKAATIAAAPGLDPALTDSQVTVGSCVPTPGDTDVLTTTVTVAYPLDFLTDYLAGIVSAGEGNIIGLGVMRCSTT